MEKSFLCYFKKHNNYYLQHKTSRWIHTTVGFIIDSCLVQTASRELSDPFSLIHDSTPRFPLFTLCWGDYALLTPTSTLRHSHTNSQTHTRTYTLSGPAWRRLLRAANFGAAGAHILLNGVPVDWQHRMRLTLAACSTMEFGKVWSRYQRTLLITMMMFKLGELPTLSFWFFSSWMYKITITSTVTSKRTKV